MTTNVAESKLPPLPRAVQARMDRINARANEPKPPADGGGEPTPPAATEPSPPSPPSAAAPTPAPTPAPATSSTPTPAPHAGDPRENDPTYWKQRFKVTEGMLRTAQERHAAELERRDEEITQLRTRVRELEASNTTTAKVDLSLFFTPEQIDRFGEDQCEAMATAAMQASRQQAQKLIDAEVKPLREKSEASAKQAKDAKEAAFWQRLAELQPNFQEINARQDWLAWLTEVDDKTGLDRQTILDNHRARQNADGVAMVFKDFERSLERPVPPAAPPNRGGGGGGEPPPPSPAARMGYPTRDEIRDFYKRKALGKVGEKERQEFEERLRSKAAA